MSYLNCHCLILYFPTPNHFFFFFFTSKIGTATRCYALCHTFRSWTMLQWIQKRSSRQWSVVWPSPSLTHQWHRGERMAIFFFCILREKKKKKVILTGWFLTSSFSPYPHSPFSSFLVLLISLIVTFTPVLYLHQRGAGNAKVEQHGGVSAQRRGQQPLGLLASILRAPLLTNHNPNAVQSTGGLIRIALRAM